MLGLPLRALSEIIVGIVKDTRTNSHTVFGSHAILGVESLAKSAGKACRPPTAAWGCREGRQRAGLKRAAHPQGLVNFADGAQQRGRIVTSNFLDKLSLRVSFCRSVRKSGSTQENCQKHQRASDTNPNQ